MATPQGRPQRFLVYSTAGPQRDLASEARERLRHDPWYAHAILALVWVKRWRIFIDTWAATSGT